MAASTRRYGAAEAAATALEIRVATVGVWLFLAADVFFFAAWYFAFFYLRALNNDGAWLVQGLTRPSKPYGTIVLVLALVSAAAYFLATRLTVRTLPWRVLTVGALLVGLGAGVLQGYEMWHLGFGLTQGGYPSVFTGLTGSWLVQFLGGMFWMATIVAQARPGGDTVTRPASSISFGHFLYFVTAIAVINWVVLYFLP